MDFNKAFLAYDDLDGVMCLTTEERMSQREAAERGVKAVGLNQVREIQREWFEDEKIREMFFRRLSELKKL